MTKKCPKCKRALDESKFNWKIKNKQRATYCKQCSRKYIRDHYKRNKDYYLKKARKRNLEQKEIVTNYVKKFLNSHPCVDCGETDILVLEFDHLDQAKKKYDINRIIRQRMSLKNIEARN